MGAACLAPYRLIDLDQYIQGNQQAGQAEKRIKDAASGKIAEIMFLHALDIKGCRRDAHENKRINIRGLDQPFSSGNIEIGMEKMDIHRKQIHNKKMIRSADEKCCFFRLDIERKKNVKVKK